MTPNRGDWRTYSPDTLSWYEWDEAHFVFDPASGQTHFLNELAAEIVEFLCTSQLAAEQIYQRILASYTLDPDDALLDSIHNMLKHLDGLGLIIRVEA